jgi:hypothetical protein
MDMYAVYGRAVGRTEWSLYEVFATQSEAEGCAAALVAPAEGGAVPGEGEAWVEAAVVEAPANTEAAEHLPAAWTEAVVARFSRRAKVRA